MRRYIPIIIALSLLASSCLKDPITPRTVPEAPQVGYEESSLSRTKVMLTGSFPELESVSEYGFELAEGSFGDNRSVFFRNPQIDADGNYSAPAVLVPGSYYVLRSYITNGSAVLYSDEVTFQAPLKSAPSVSDVVIEEGCLVAHIEDDGGRKINEAGFCWSESSDLKDIRKNRARATDLDDNSFSVPVDLLAPGKAYYIIAYAENSDNSSSEVYGYSPNVFVLELYGDHTVWFDDKVFENELLKEHDTDHNGYLSYNELEAITSLSICTDELTSLNEFSKLPPLESLSLCGSAPGKGVLSSLDLAPNPGLKTLRCDNNLLTSLDLSLFPALDTLSCPGNQLDTLDLGKVPGLKYLDCSGNPLHSVDLSLLSVLSFLDLSGCLLDKNNTLDIGNSPLLEQLIVHDCTGINRIYVPLGFVFTEHPGFSIDNSISIDTAPYLIIPINDEAFKACLIENQYDSDGDGNISAGEAEKVTYLSYTSNKIASFSGIEYMTHLKKLNMSPSYYLWSDGQLIAYLDSNDNILPKGQIAELDLSYNTELTTLTINNYSIDDFVLRGEKTPSSINLQCNFTIVNKVTIDDCPLLESFICQQASIAQLHISSCRLLKTVNVQNNLLEEVDLTRLSSLRELYLADNNLKYLNVRSFPNLESLYCKNNPNLKEVWISQDQNIKTLSYDENMTVIRDNEL